MTDKLLKLPKEIELLGNSVVLTSLEDAKVRGLSTSDIQIVCEEVSYEIDKYNSENNNEMLPKTPEIIYDQLEKGLSCLIVAFDSTCDDGERWRMLYHGSIYPVFENAEENILNTQVFELGSAITQSDFRKGLGLGTKGIGIRLDMIKRKATDKVETFGISTVKRAVTGHTFHKFGISPVSFWDHPYTSFLTNTCEKSSERFGHEQCEYRRPVGESDAKTLLNSFVQIDGNTYLPCTLICTDHEAIKRFEKKCRDIHQDMGGTPLFQNDISVASYKRASDFFDQIKEYAKTK